MPPKAREEKETSMEQILQTIRGVIAGEIDKLETSDEVLELTEMVAEDGSVNTIKPAANGHVKAETNDVLNDIDSVLSDTHAAPEKKEEPKAKPAKPSAEKVVAPVQPEPDVVIDEAVEEPEEHEETPPLEEMKEAVVGLADSVGGAKVKETVKSAVTPKPEVKAEPDEAEEEEPKEEKIAPSKQRVKASGLISERSAEASIEALQTLMHSVPKPRPEPSFRSGATLEELVIEALKPQLSYWLDENLPKLVRQLVEKEIKRLIPKDE